MKAIQSELGEGNELAEEIAQFREKIEAASMPKPAEDEALRQLKKLERMHPDAAETATIGIPRERKSLNESSSRFGSMRRRLSSAATTI